MQRALAKRTVVAELFLAGIAGKQGSFLHLYRMRLSRGKERGVPEDAFFAPRLSESLFSLQGRHRGRLRKRRRDSAGRKVELHKADHWRQMHWLEGRLGQLSSRGLFREGKSRLAVAIEAFPPNPPTQANEENEIALHGRRQRRRCNPLKVLGVCFVCFLQESSKNLKRAPEFFSLVLTGRGGPCALRERERRCGRRLQRMRGDTY